MNSIYMPFLRHYKWKFIFSRICGLKTLLNNGALDFAFISFIFPDSNIYFVSVYAWETWKWKINSCHYFSFLNILLDKVCVQSAVLCHLLFSVLSDNRKALMSVISINLKIKSFKIYLLLSKQFFTYELDKNTYFDRFARSTA